METLDWDIPDGSFTVEIDGQIHHLAMDFLISDLTLCGLSSEGIDMSEDVEVTCKECDEQMLEVLISAGAF